MVMDYSPGLKTCKPACPSSRPWPATVRRLCSRDINHYRNAFNKILDEMERKARWWKRRPGLHLHRADGLQLIYPDDNALAGAVGQSWQTLPR